MFCAGIPTPLSMTHMRTPAGAGSMRRVMSLSDLPDSSHAYLALRTRFTRICSTLCLSTVIGGTSLNSRRSVDAVAYEGAGVQAQAVLHQIDHGDGFGDAAELGIALLHRHGILDVLQVVAQRCRALRAPSSGRSSTARRARSGIPACACRARRWRGSRPPRGPFPAAGRPRGTRPGLWTVLTRSVTRLAEILTLFKMLPTLCSTLVATSAMPAWREAIMSCLCTRSSSSADSLRALMSRRNSTEYSGLASPPRTSAVVMRTQRKLPSLRM